MRETAQLHIETIRAKIEALRSMEKTLSHLIERCAGNERPDCPILDGLSGD